MKHISFLLKNLLLATKGGIALIILLFLWGIWRAGNHFFALFNAPPSAPVVNVSGLVVEKIRGISELTTAVFTIETVVPTSQDRKLGNFVVGTTKLLYIARGEVKAGIDLNNLTAENIKIHNKTIQIDLPPPTILDNKLDLDRSSVYHYDRGFLGLGPDVAPQLQTIAQRETLEKIVTSACREGILEEANERAKLAITQLLTTAGYDEIDVNTTVPSSQNCQLNGNDQSARNLRPAVGMQP